MRYFFTLSLVGLGFVMASSFSSCAGGDATLQTRIERKIQTPGTSNVEIGTAHYNRYSQGFEEPWPFGPYSTF